MKRIEIMVMKPQVGLDAFPQRWRRLQVAEAPAPRLAFGSLQELFCASSKNGCSYCSTWLCMRL
jgi:hypothetical protein